MKTLITTLALAALAASCTVQVESSDTSAPTPTPTPSAGAPAAQVVSSSVHEVRCGCKIDAVGHCGNYVDIDGTWLEIANPAKHGLGKMEWCGATETVNAKVAGTRDGEAIMLSELEVQ